MAEETEAGHGVVVQNGEAVAVGAGHETTGAAVLEHAEVAMPQLDLAIYPNLIFWLVVSLVAIYMILTRVALPRVGAILAERNDAISNDLEQAALYKRRATEAEAAYNAALAKAREESQKIAAEAKAAVGKELAVVMAKADAEIAAKAAESEARIREIEASAAQSVAEVAKSTAEAIVAALGPRAIDSAAIDAAVTARLGELTMDFLNNTNIVVGIGFVLFVGVLLYYNVPGMITAKLDERSVKIKRDLDEARALRDEAQTLLAGFERKQKEVQGQADDIVAAARAESERAAVVAKEDIRRSMERRLATATEQIAAAEKAAIRQIKDRAVTVAVAAAADVIARNMQAQDADALIDASIAEVGAKLH